MEQEYSILQKIKNWLKSGDSNKEQNTACRAEAQDLVDCIKQTDCFKQGYSLQYCSNNTDQCIKQISAYYSCRRYLVDIRTHFSRDRSHS